MNCLIHIIKSFINTLLKLAQVFLIYYFLVNQNHLESFKILTLNTYIYNLNPNEAIKIIVLI